jgi:hypothetical protein
MAIAVLELDFFSIKAALQEIPGTGASDLGQLLAARPEAVRALMDTKLVLDGNSSSLALFDCDRQALPGGATNGCSA